MDDFDLLRERSRQKKERTIAAALNEYKATMARIAAIEVAWLRSRLQSPPGRR